MVPSYTIPVLKARTSADDLVLEKNGDRPLSAGGRGKHSGNDTKIN